jgi:rhomboid protease GluP
MTREFTRRVQEASEFDARFYNMSTLIMLAQVVVMALMIRAGGVRPIAENLMLGPSVYVMLDYGAQQGGFIIYEDQWWRIITAMFVHAGIIHLACNVYVQVKT